MVTPPVVDMYRSASTKPIVQTRDKNFRYYNNGLSISFIVLDMNSIDEGKNNVCVSSVKEHTDEVKKSILGLNSSVCCPMNLRSRTFLAGM